MQKVVIKPVILLMAGLVFLYASNWLHPYIETLPDHQYEVFELLPYIFGILTVLLALHFGQTRALLLATLLSAAYYTHKSAINPAQTSTIFLITFLLPAIASIAVYGKDSGILSIGGKLRIALILSIISAGAWLLYNPNYLELIHKWQLLKNINTFHLPQALVLSWLLSLSLLLRQCTRAKSSLGYVSLTAAALPIVVSHYLPDEVNLVSGYATALLLVLFAVVQSAYQMAFIDKLTGLPNRRALDMQLLKLPRRYSIAMLDVDHFKQFNDKYGHDVGDQVLKMVAGRLAEVRGGGKPARYGGEEFCIVFPRKMTDSVVEQLEAVREAVETSQFQLRRSPRGKRGARSRAQKVSVTISIGVSERSGQHPQPEKVIKRADQALYQAKKKGRNRVVTLK